MKDGTVKRVSALHRMALRSTRGRLGRTLPGVGAPMLLLTTNGRRTGREHTVPLLYLEDSGDLIVIASYGGRDYPPAWYLNLVAHPDVEVEVDGTRIPARARETEGDDRAGLWEAAVVAYSGYTQYQGRTERVIPVIRLTPAGA